MQIFEIKQPKKSPKVTLVGAGPGSRDLITLRGYRALQHADAILYDALVDPGLLDEVSGDIPKIYVGKRCGKDGISQDGINALLVEHAFTYGHVVRLKGGDPFVFGRASEEIEHLEYFGIPVDVVPGISSAIAAPAGQGIPVTKRGVSTSFWVVTATTKEGTFPKDLQLASQSSATLLILMGVRKLKQIVDLVCKHRSGMTPFALIQNASKDTERCTTGTLNNAAAITKTIDLTQPGVIVIGDVVAEHPSFFEEEVRRVLHSTI